MRLPLARTVTRGDVVLLGAGGIYWGAATAGVLAVLTLSVPWILILSTPLWAWLGAQAGRWLAPPVSSTRQHRYRIAGAVSLPLFLAGTQNLHAPGAGELMLLIAAGWIAAHLYHRSTGQAHTRPIRRPR